MIEMSFLVDEAEVKRRLGAMADQSSKVIARAANRAATTGKVSITRNTQKRYDIVQSDINNNATFKLEKATGTSPTAKLEYIGEHRNLYLWNKKRAVTPNIVVKFSHGKPNVKAYKARIMKGHRRAKLEGQNKPFIQHVRKGEESEFIGLFRRSNENRDAKLEGVGAAAVPQIIKNEETMALFRQNAGEMFQKRLEHEIKRVLEGH